MLVCCCMCTMEDLIVTVKQGQLLGKVDIDRKGKQFLTFLGIPYAKPPLGELRFKAPQPAESWEGIRDATKDGNRCFCAQHFNDDGKILTDNAESGSEDCLFLNVFTHELYKGHTTLKPVMFWIHGGGFVTGSSSILMYGPNNLMAEDIVLVTINYRLGIFGFLCLEDSSLGVPGNAGYKDMVLALKWVKENVGMFGGDPGNVTIFGESAGSAAVQYLILSPMAKGLFHKAILQSGSALSSWTKGTRGAEYTAKSLGVDTKDEKTLLKKLQSMTTQAVYNIQKMNPDMLSAGFVRPFCAVIEKTTLEPMFLPRDPIDLLTSGEYNQVPVIIGYVSNEAYLLHSMGKNVILPVYMLGDEHIVPIQLGLDKNSKEHQKTAEKIKKFYFRNGKVNEEVLPYFVLGSDNVMVRDIHSSIKYFIKTSKEPVFVYKMTIETNLNVFKAISKILFPGATHADDILYLFKSIMCPPVKPGSIEDTAIERFVKLWTNFARTSNPNNDNEEVLKGVNWKPAIVDTLHYLDIGEKLESNVNPDAEQIKFWEEEIFKSVPTF